MSRRAKVYWSVVGVGVGLALVGVVTGTVGMLTESHTLMGWMTAAVFPELVVVAAVFVIRKGPTRPHPR